MNYLLMFKEKVIDSINDYIVTPVNDYVVTPVNDYVVTPVNDYVVTPVNDYVVTPVIRNPINNYIVSPIQNLVKRDKYTHMDTYIDLDLDTYTTFTSYPASISSSPLLDKQLEVTYFENIQEKMYYSGLTFKASIFFFINALLPNTLKNEGHTVLENLKKND
jgi:hypothetical protein